MKKRISIYTMDTAILFKLLTKGIFPLSITITKDGMDFGKELNYFEDEDGLIIGTTKIPDPSVLVHLYVIATKPIPKYPHGVQKTIAVTDKIFSEDIIVPNEEMKKGLQYKFDMDGNLYKALSKFNRPPLEMDITPAMMEDTLEIMDSDKVKECLDDFVEKQWFEYAGVAKKILDQRKQPQ